MITLESPRERAILVAAPLKRTSSHAAEEHLEELARLADTAGAEIVGTLVQRLDSRHPKFYIGEGKAEELRLAAEEKEATLIVFDEELTPAQGKNLEDLLNLRIIDRAELILDIFASRARTAEAKMQVELAQLQYMLPRLTRMWAHLSRVRGGIGMRGPGETQLETDRRMIGQKISRLKGDLERVARQRATQRKGRDDAFRASLVGYTNAGKSSLLRALSGADVFVEDRLFATLDAATRSVDLGDGYHCLLTDTVGFIRKLPHHLVASFRATLEEAADADLLLHVIDISHPGWEEQKEVVEEVIDVLELDDRPVVLVFNKIDRLTHEEEEIWRTRAATDYPQPAVFVSTVEPGGVESLRDFLQDRIRARSPEVRIAVPASLGGVVAEIYREGEVVAREDVDGRVIVRVRLPAAALGRLREHSEVEFSETG
ncbi:MAG TPA: GTPase HflX [Longimicrobiaceae bacterium]|nr:GTPase HflX [Longimicrobiaceae bacterium]